MSNRPSPTGSRSVHPALGRIAHYEEKARRLRSAFIADGAAKLYARLDCFVRRFACRIAATLFGSDCMHAAARRAVGV